MSGGRWSEFENVARHWALFDRMIEHLPLKPVDLARYAGGRSFREAAKLCANCRSAERCEGWLSRATSDAGPPDFCPLGRIGID